MWRRWLMLATLAAAAAVAGVVTVLVMATPPPEPAPAVGAAAAIPPVSQLPRLRPLWSAPGLSTIGLQYERSIVRAGTVFAWQFAQPTALVALDLRTGKQRWRMPMPGENAPAVAIAGQLALVFRTIGATAVDLATGEQRWTTRVCGFNGDVQVLADLHVGVGVCTLRPPPEKTGSWFNDNMAVAIDLRTGRELWREPNEWPVEALTATGGVVYIARQIAELPQRPLGVSALDPRSGKVLRGFGLPAHVPPRGHVMPGHPDRALFVGRELVAVDITQGRVLWQVAMPSPIQSPLTRRWPELSDGRLLVGYDNHVRELDVRSGATVADWDLPDAISPGRRLTVRPAPGGGVLVVKDNERAPALVVHFEARGAPAKLAVLAVPYEGLLAIEDGVAVVRKHTAAGMAALEGYAAFDGIASEAKGLDASARLRAILERQPWRFSRGSIGKPEQAAPLAELRAVAGFEAALAAMARDPSSPSHDAAVDAVVATRISGAAPILMAEVARPLDFPKPTGDRDADSFARSRIQNAMNRRNELVASLADLDDVKAADFLTPVLFDAQSPIRLGWQDWETWGGWPESGYGKKRWAASESSSENAFSPYLQAPAGRPEAHAAIYQLLARLGRPADVAALARFDAERGVAGGWARLCDADDVIKQRYVDPLPVSAGLGLCQGWDVDGYRVTHSQAIWLRQRRSDGSYGPPAWAADPGGDSQFDRVTVRGARAVANKRIRITGRTGYWGKEPNWSTTVDPAVVFADRDGDGLTDKTEAALGTDPARADSDGDGVPDGNDPAPFAPPSTSDAAHVHDEVLRFVTTFRAGGPVAVYVDAASWVGGGGGGVRAAGVALHRRGELRDSRADRGTKRCETLVAIGAITVRGATAEATATWPAENGNGTVEHKLGLRKVGGVWRVTEDRGPMF